MRKKSKVVFILSIPPPYGGGEIVSKFLLDKLINEYDFITYSRKNYSKSKQANKNSFSFFFGIIFIMKTIWQLIKLNPEGVYIGLPKGFLAFTRNSIVILYASILNKRIYCELHGMNFPFYNGKGFKSKYLIFILNKVNKIRVLSETIKKYFIEIGYKGDIYVINNGIEKPIDLQSKNNRHTIDCLNLLYFGAISNQKGFLKVLLLVSKLKAKNIHFHLNVIGEWVFEAEKRKYYSFIKENKIEHLISFKGKLFGLEKWEAISQNDVLLHFSEFDGQPLTIIECMSLGIPSIATKVGGIPEMINSGVDGFLIDSVNEATEIIKVIDSSKDVLNNCKENTIKTFKNNYTSKAMVDGILKMIAN
jgi:glycosyltransferase involved in cell wall biosynthesis